MRYNRAIAYNNRDVGPTAKHSIHGQRRRRAGVACNASYLCV